MTSKYSPYVLCLLISILVVTLYISDFSPLIRLQWKIQDLMYSFRGEDNFSSDIAIVNIDDNTLKQYGEWPWNRDRLADLVAAVGSGQPKTVVLDLIFDHNTEQDTLGFTKILAGQMSWMKNVIVPYEISPAEFRDQKMSKPKTLRKYSVQVNNELGILDENAALPVRKIFDPPDQICEYASGLGFKYDLFDSDRKVRWTPLVMYYEGYYYPSTALLAAAQQLGVEPSAIVIQGGQSIKVASVDVPTNNYGELFINYNKSGQSFKQISAADILNESVSPDILKDKLVIISVNASTASEFFATPISAKLSAAEKFANVTENIIHANFINRIDAAPGVDMLILFGLGIAFAFILPRVSLLYRFVILMVSFFVLANLNFVLFNFYKILAQPMYIGLELFLLLLASPILDTEYLSSLSIFSGNAEKPGKTKLPKIELEQQEIQKEEPAGQKDEAKTDAPRPSASKSFDEFEKTVAAEHAPDSTSDKTVKTESKPDEASWQQSEEQQQSQEHRPLPQESGINRTTAYEDSVESAPPRQPVDKQALNDDSQPIKYLGRYEVLEILGQGAMGKVFKGIDPAINRNVALKTIRLDFVSDPEELAELKERLFREARAAGMLSHPNIVTIYDVGTEKKLQYIAMEYLQGQTLEDMIRRKVKFNYRIIAEIITQICSALEYAHNQGIVHRDIKPANIMVLPNYVVKVMDFGIARIDSTSMTRTGIAMGTPNYISPEQLQGRAIDNRCDLFSLGVVMYEMLVNRRPFHGENLTSLIYNIVNNEPELPSSIDNSIPSLFDRVIDKALKKNPEERYQKASEISFALSDFLHSFASKRSTPV